MKGIFFGDSIVECGHLEAPKRWAERVRLGSSAVSWEARGVSGQNTRQALERLQADVLKVGAGILYVQFGINDSCHWDSLNGCPVVSPDAFKANLAEVVLKARAFGIGRIALATNHPLARPRMEKNGKSHGQNCARYNELVRQVAQEVSVDLVDHEAHWQAHGTTAWLEADGIHLSEQGADAYAQLVGQWASGLARGQE